MQRTANPRMWVRFPPGPPVVCRETFVLDRAHSRLVPAAVLFSTLEPSILWPAWLCALIPDRIENAMAREIAEFAYDLHSGLAAHQVSEFDDLHVVGMAATLAIHIKGLGQIDYEVLRKSQIISRRYLQSR
jgi:hypothetical protein